MPRTDRRPRQRLDAESRRAEILRAAGRAFTTQPYDKVSVARIAEAAGASEALVHRYFQSKSGLYLEVNRAGLAILLERQQAADDPAAGLRARLESTVRIYLDAVAEWSIGWLSPLRSPGGEPVEAATLRRHGRAHYAELLRELLGLPADPALGYALSGYLGFLDECCVLWAERGHPATEREPLTAQAIAALSAALTTAGRPVTL